jgi:beta-glucanase (GH16 family)
MKWVLLVAILYAAIATASQPDSNAAEGAQAAALGPRKLRALKQDVDASLLNNQTFALFDAKIASFSPCLGVDWELLWSDEFNDYGSPVVDPKKWSVQTGDGSQYGIPGWGNDELQYYTERSSNIYVQDGKLVIQAQRESGENLDWMYKKCLNECDYWCSTDETKSQGDIPGCIETCSVPRCDTIKANAVTSARIRTFNKLAVVPSEDYPSIRIEASVKVPRGTGLWPAFWMLPDQGARSNCSGCGLYSDWPASGEIDIFEGANDMSNVLGTIFYGGEGEVQQYSGGGGPFSVDGFQTIALEWDFDQMRWFIDDRQFHAADSAAKLNSNGQPGGWYSKNGQGNAPFDAAFYLIMNLAVGGKFPNADPAATLADLSVGAKQMEIDFVRVCGKAATPPETPV